MKKLCLALAVLFCISDFSIKAEAMTVSAYSAIVIEADSGRVIFEKNPDERMAMASTTKIMTALLCLEEENIHTEFTVNPDAIMVEGTSMGLKKDDKVTLHTLAAGMLLASGNDAANAAAVRVAGTISEFAIMMNKRAQSIGMENTNFVTPSGLDDENHYSTARDMALLARVALLNPDFLSLCSQKSMKLSYGNPPYTRWLSNHNKLLKTYDGCIGVKTGFTKKAGRCLVSAAERDGVRLICVTLKAPNDWDDHKKLLDYGFANVKKVSLPVPPLSFEVKNGVESEVSGVVKETPFSTIAEDDLKNIETKVIAASHLEAPVFEGDYIGKIYYYLNGEVVKKASIQAENTVLMKEKPPTLWDKIRNFLKGHFKWTE